MSSLFYSKSSEIAEAVKIGGKAKNLVIISNKTIPVPNFIALSVDFFEEFMGNSMAELKKILEVDYYQTGEINDVSGKITSMIDKVEFQEKIKNSLLKEIEKNLGKLGTMYFSVRSSATDEDSKEHSFAGQLESYLYIKTKEQLFKAIKDCFKSAFSDRAMSYRFMNKLPLHSVRPAVIIQEMIFGEVSGVMFTGNPLNNNPDQTLINAAYGIGEGIVSGELDTDSWSIDEDGKIIKRFVAVKKNMVTFNSQDGYGTKIEKVKESVVEKPALNDDTVLSLYHFGKKIEEIFDHHPQDIEWCIANNKIYILQSRPVTTMSQIDKKERKTILDNSNIIESYPGVITPLTFSFSHRVYEKVYERFYYIAGTSKKRIQEHSHDFRNMISYFNSRAYYNLNSWYETMMLFPGYKYNRWFMENMMGVKDSAKFEKKRSEKLYQRLIKDYPQLLKGIVKVGYLFFFTSSIVNKFIKDFYKYTGEYMDEKFFSYSNKDILEKYLFLEKKTFCKWDAPIINDFSVMIFYGMLTKKIAKLNITDKAGLQNDLLCGQGDVESTKPTKEIIRISNIIRKDELLKKVFEENDEKKLEEMILNSKDQKFAEIRKILKEYISEYGFRCMNEMKLEEDTLKENPEFLFTMIKNYLRKPAIDLADMASKEKQARISAEKMLFTQISGIEKLKTKWILHHARKAIKNREKLRFMRTKIYGIFRSMFNAIGRNFEKDGLIDHYKDVYFLHHSDLFELVEGRSVNYDIIKQIIQIRKDKYETDKVQEPHERMYFYGDMYKRNFVEILSDDEVEYCNNSEDTNVLRGIPCSPGTIEGNVKIVLSPVDANLNGEILVAKRTDPGWVPLFPSISGIIIERGSPLSHSAVVAREMGIPAIVGVRKVTEVISDNQRVKMNGSTGMIEKIEELDEAKGA